uniref:Uncharacterized protein n=1 Tax=Ananas comosus var. bracteatus TaxID=296719 RepID=A0A6V7NNT6_ANACO|nr:unnamed protein product [Ananas comosus var. bracteatus]
MAAAAYIRPKRASAPLDAAARARLRGDEVAMGGYDSSGSEHAALSGLVHAFFESEAGGGDAVDGAAAASVAAATAVEDSTAGGVRRGGRRSGREDGRGGEGASGCRRQGRFLPDSADGRRVGGGGSAGGIPEKPVGVLPRRDGPAARVRLQCRALQGAVGRVEGNRRRNYEYIDVVAAATADDGVGGSRYIIDVGFAAEFELARATEEYARVAAALPAPGAERAAVAEASVHGRQVARPLPPHHQPPAGLRGSRCGRVAVAAAGGGGDVVCRAVGFAAPLPQPERPCYYYY